MVNKSRMIYLGHCLSSWGDRMWSYAVAVFLMRLDSNSLILTAIYGLFISGSVLMFGSSVGNWIDKMPRLRAAQLSLLIQNSSVACYAIILLTVESMSSKTYGLLMFAKVSAIVIGVVARLASTALSIIIQKDWIVVIADGDQSMLSSLNSVLRRIDLLTKLLAPLVCGLIITFGSFKVGCGFIAGWNILSMFFEYFILRSVYRNTPKLATKSKDVSAIPVENPSEHDKTLLGEESSAAPEDRIQLDRKNSEDPGKLYSMFKFILLIPKGWKQYMSQSTVLVGLGLSFLYMTVLGIDIISNAFMLSQCFSASLVGIVVGASAVTGILSTFMYSPLVSRIGTVKTGLLASLCQVLTLVPCLASIFVAGSPFIYLPVLNHDYSNSYESNNVTLQFNALSPTTVSQVNEHQNVLLKCEDGVQPPSSYLSITMLMIGIVLGRIGLWGFDLAATQLFQENIKEHERGVVGGVQSSMNSLMDLLHFILVIALPKPGQFGVHVIVSVTFVTVGHIMYGVYSYKNWNVAQNEPDSDS